MISTAETSDRLTHRSYPGARVHLLEVVHLLLSALPPFPTGYLGRMYVVNLPARMAEDSVHEIVAVNLYSWLRTSKD